MIVWWAASHSFSTPDFFSTAPARVPPLPSPASRKGILDTWIWQQALGVALLIEFAWYEISKAMTMTRFYEPDLSTDLDSPFIRDGANKLVRRSYWMDMDDRTLVMVMVSGIGSHLTNDEKRAHLADLRREHLIDQVCVQEILPPKK
jgi:hypothetical protein